MMTSTIFPPLARGLRAIKSLFSNSCCRIFYRGHMVMAKRLGSWSIPLASFVCAAVIATFSSPALSAFGLRMMQTSTGTPPPSCCDCNTYSCPSGAKIMPAGQTCATKKPVRYFTGEKLMAVSELSSESQGSWSAGRSFVSNTAYADVSSPLGGGWRMSGSLYKLAQQNSFVVLLSGSTVARTFIDNGNGTYSPSYYFLDSLTLNSGAHTFTYTDLDGKQWLFDDFTGLAGVGRVGTLKQYIDAAGNTHTLTYNTAAGPAQGKLSQVQAIFVQGTSTYEEDWLYNYYLTGVSAGFLQSVVLRRTLNAVDQGIVRQTLYTYYQSGGPNGAVNTLQRAQVLDPSSVVLDTRYYRYNAVDTNGNLPIRYVLDATGYERALFSLGSDAAIDAAADATIAPWAQYFLQYDSQSRITLETVQGTGCGCGSTPGLGTYTFTYTDSAFGPDGPNTWKRKTVETLPDGNQNIVYSSGFGQTMLNVFKDVTSGQQWITYNQYDAAGRVTMSVNPSGVTGFSEADPALVSGGFLSSAAGLVNTYTYYTTTNIGLGQVAGFMATTNLKQGQTGTAIPQSQILYTSRAGTSGTIYPVASQTVYRNTDGTGAQTTNLTYTWQGSTNQISQRTATFPIVTTAQNGSNAATAVDMVMDTFGRANWMRDEDGFLHYVEYDQLNGGNAKTIVDVNAALTTDFLNLPAGWTTPVGGGLHLKTLMTLDALARTTKLTDPSGNVTYTLYKDSNHEVRVYPGWITATNLPTGPTRMSREDRAHSYVETLTMSATPAVTGGLPTGAEAVSGLQSLSRDYLDTGDRVTNTDSYFDFSSGGFVYSTNANIGTMGTNYYRRLYNYDLKGRKDRDVEWTGTIRRSFYDSRDRVQSTWIGTNDTPASGTWSPGNNTAPSNMIQVTGNQYDAGGVGDGTLTKSSVYTGVSMTLDSFYKYDFRNRLTDSRDVDNVAGQNAYDNLNQVTQIQTYADVNANFVIDSGELRRKAQTNFDEKGQVYQTVRYNVDPSTGAVGDSLTSNLWSNARRLSIKTRGPNGEFRKAQYDGARRRTASFVSFDDAESTYATASTVVSDRVVDETVTSYDAASNVIQTTRYQRTSTSTQTGDLATSWTAAKSRRTFGAQWFDPANRMTDVVDYGNNGGSTFTRPATPPAPNTSNNYLVTHYDFDAGGRQNKTTSNLARVTQETFDGLGRTTKKVENFSGTGVPVETDLDLNRTTLLVFDASGRLSQLTALNPKGTGLGVESQITQYVYGTIANQAAPAVFRNDIMVAEIYPDSDDTYNPAGAAGSQLGNGTDGVYDRTEYTYDFASRKSTMKDQRGALHTYAYDTAGRWSSDTVTTLPSGVDGSILRAGRAYDSLSRPQLATNYSDTGGTTVVNQVKYTYDGWGNTIKDEQEHAGAVVPGTTAAYQIAYADGGSGGVGKYIRPASMTYPNGRAVYLNYPAAGSTSVGDHLSRVDNIANDSSGTSQFAQYTYLGTNVIGQINHPLVTNGLQLLVATGGNPAQWDNFGRVLDQEWKATTGTVIHDRYKHTYDRESNRLTRDVLATGAPTTQDQFYTYDGLNRLTEMNRGTLASGKITDANAKFSQKWTALESQGNWRGFQVAPTGANSYTFQQTRSHNKANEIDTDNNDANAAGNSISGTGGADWIDPTYDKGGNLVSYPQAGAETTRQWATYDAWNRLVKVQADSGGVPGTEIAEYQYDARSWRTVKLVPNGSNWNRTDYYYTCTWQCVEERTLTNTASKTTVATVPHFQWVWDLRYIDAVVLRDENKDGDNSCTGGADQRIFYTQDVNVNTTALVDTTGAVVERYTYDAYGSVNVLSPTWASQSAALFNNEVLFAGYRKDSETALYHVRNRTYHSSLGRWAQRDTVRYLDGMNLYQYARSLPTSFVDPTGFQAQAPPDPNGFTIYDGARGSGSGDPGGNAKVTVTPKNICDEDKAAEIKVDIFVECLQPPVNKDDGYLVVDGTKQNPTPGKPTDGGNKTFEYSYTITDKVCPVDQSKGQTYIAFVISMYVVPPDPKDPKVEPKTGAMATVQIDWSYKCKKQKEKPCCKVDEAFKATFKIQNYGEKDSNKDANLPLTPPKPGK
jgi:RHS repeat-associated protein